MKKLKERWGITSNFQALIIFVVFGITGSTSAKLAGPIVEFMGITAESVSLWLYWPLRILIIFPLYQVLLIFFGFIFGQFAFFWNFEKKMLSRLGFKKFLD
jgi:hypothetical protein